MSKRNIIQLRDYHINKGRNNNGTPIFPKTRPEAIEGFLEYIGTVVDSGITEVENLPQTGEEGTIYYNTTTKKYYTYDNTDGFELIGSPNMEVINSNFTSHSGSTLPIAGSILSYDIEPNKLYDFGTAYIGLCLYPTKTSNTIAYEYICRFTAALSFGSGASAVTADSFNLIVDGVEFPDNTIEIEDGHTYELNILHGVAMLADITSTPANNG